ncbi:MAG: hypothetical protein A2039_09170 [Candidatus Melainabacteria bacterium GWA2_34_9]|nr:MAG: hypothetical protein A2039_09170 [Candidatus Melainabacteria bacterium GWA2_34_9]
MLIMRKNKELDNSESRLNYLISMLKNKLDSEELNRTYNRLLIERATIRKKLEFKKSKNVLTNFCQKLNKKRQEKLICDYFKSQSC